VLAARCPRPGTRAVPTRQVWKQQPQLSTAERRKNAPAIGALASRCNLVLEPAVRCQLQGARQRSTPSARAANRRWVTGSTTRFWEGPAGVTGRADGSNDPNSVTSGVLVLPQAGTDCILIRPGRVDVRALPSVRVSPLLDRLLGRPECAWCRRVSHRRLRAVRQARPHLPRGFRRPAKIAPRSCDRPHASHSGFP
jgi:hypothetical protein